MHRSLLLIVGLISFSICFSTTAFAIQIAKVKGRGVLIKLEGEATQAGDMFYALNSAGKKKAVIKITKVKGGSAVGQITAGKAEAGMALQRRSGAVASHGSHSSSGGAFLRSKSYWGVLGGLNMNTMDVDLPSPLSQTVSLSGMSFSLKGLFDYELFDHIWFRGTSGYQGFTASGSSKCGTGTSACNVSISYLSFDFLGRYIFTDGSIRPWLGGGFSMLFPAAKSSTALESSSITTSSTLVLAGGADWSINKEMYIPISLEYAMFPKSSTTSANWIALRAGVAWPF
jgi:hypothetical protein